MIETSATTARWVRRVALAAGPLAAVALWTLPPIGTDPGMLTWTGRLTLGVAAWMAVWWLSEAVPLEATALLPLLLFPALNIAPIKAAAAPYADPTIFFFMGGMMMGAAMERWGLPRRFALHVLARVGVHPGALIFGAMAATAIISMWVNNTSTCVMMLPIGLSIVRIVERGAGGGDAKGVDNFATAMVLGIAWAATIGGVGTLFGTAPNIILQGAVQNLMGERLTFGEYALIGMPIVALYLPMVWAVLMWFYPPRVAGTPETRDAIRRELTELGPMTRPEWFVLGVLAGAMILWTIQDPINSTLRGWTGWLTADGKGVPRVFSEAGVAILAAVTLFMLPARTPDGRRTSVLDWPTANSIQWGVLVLFGGGLALAEAMTATGVNTYLGGFFEGLRGMPLVVIVLGVAAFVTFATEVASNTAIATTFLPVAFAAAQKLGIHPYYLMLPVALSASYAFMMPMGTPPNAMAIATGRVRIGQMARPGFVLNLTAIGLITVYVTYIAPLVLTMK
jgi:solute carrier family 13 (sodium-dependent dicarboxylate transporter), member 2/3/5